VPSYCIQYVADVDHKPSGGVVGSIFLHDQSLEEAEKSAEASADGFGAASAFIVRDMGGHIHARKALGITAAAVSGFRSGRPDKTVAVVDGFSRS